MPFVNCEPEQPRARAMIRDKEKEQVRVRAIVRQWAASERVRVFHTGKALGTLMVGVAGSLFPIGKASRIVSPPAVPISPISFEAWARFKL